ncbi:ligand-binding sensor domain-containing protein [Daejeonella lutea]|uniref:histidine kinase n=1 Tax=Daejeonella lutea TaxID=572036 RepID=A0A1T5BTK8_9SPHI|nr:sensor histidine kinase [Daejeonella lutea]SKB50507.1 Two component regulator propeller [Daejeonella lutea]
MSTTAVKYILAIFLVIAFRYQGFCQKMIFNHYEVGDGLVQSQVNQISQDSTGTLWITTLGGISRFNGTAFSSLTKKDGLLNNRAFAAIADKKKNIWISTAGGISILRDRHLKNLRVPRFHNEWMWDMVCDSKNRIWGVARGSLFMITDTLITQIITINGRQPQIESIQTDSEGTLWVSIRKEGLYSFKDRWIKEVDFSFLKEDETIRSFFVDPLRKVSMVTGSALYLFDEQGIRAIHSEYFKNITEDLYSVLVDYNGYTWIGSSKGAFRVSERSQEHFTAKNGLTDAPIYGLFMDFEKNLWLGTNGYGLFRFSNDDLKVIDTDFGLVDNVVTALETDSKGKIWIGTAGAVYVLENGKLQRLNHPWPASQVLTIYRDKTSRIWIATSAGLGYFLGGTFKIIDNIPNVLSIAESDVHGILIGARTKLYSYHKGHLQEIPHFSDMPISFCQIDNGKILIGTTNGIQMLSGQSLTKPYESLPFSHSQIVSLVKYQNLMLVGTSDQGIFLWDMKTGKVANCTVVDGLLSDVIYSLKEDKYGVVWAGTGRGVNKIKINTERFKFQVFPASEGGTPAVECNTMALIFNGGEVWFGTTKGIYIYNIKSVTAPVFAPKLQITNTQLINIINGKATLTNVSKDHRHKFNPDENNLNISYQAVYLSDPENVNYQHRLVGLESAYSPPGRNTNVSYSSLSPGEYEFRVIAYSPRGVKSNTATFAFYISQPYYDTLLFRLFIILLMGITFISIREYLAARKRQKVLLRERIKEEEQLKVRQQTSEDFHDDLGNKLARISALSDLLSRMTAGKDEAAKDVIRKIKLNAAELYEGTKHIIWSISPESDNFYEIVLFIRNYATSLLEDTTIDFKVSGVFHELNEIQLPYQYSRHLTMIFKEALNNVLKHSKASSVELAVSQPDNNRIEITLFDNGIGIQEDIKKYSNGLKNMKTRAQRINGDLQIDSIPGKGTTIKLTFSPLGKHEG